MAADVSVGLDGPRRPAATVTTPAGSDSGSCDRPCATLRSTSECSCRRHLSVDSPRTWRVEPGRGRTDADDLDAGWRRRDPHRARGRARLPAHHRIRLPRDRAGVRSRLLPGMGQRPRQERPPRLLRAAGLPRLHARLPVRAVPRRPPRPGDGRHRRPDQAPGDLRRRRDRLARLVDGQRARGEPAGGDPGGRDRRRQPGQLVRFRGLGPGRLVRRRLPAARHPRTLARPPGASGDLDGDRGAHQAPARDPRPDRRRRDDPARAVARPAIPSRGGGRRPA